METAFQINWESLFVPAMHVGETVLRGTIVYLFMFGILRIMRREAGALGISDLLVIVLIADAAQNAMVADSTSITDGLILVSTIMCWDYFLDWLGYRFPAVRGVLRPRALALIRNGRVQWRNMRQEMVTEEELMAKLRENGIEKIEDVKNCYLEGEGHVSVIRKKRA